MRLITVKSIALSLLLSQSIYASKIASYPVREFTPVGKGVIDAGEVVYKFDVAKCELEPVKLDTGWTKDFLIIGAGKMDNKDYFVKFSQSSKGRKQSITAKIYFTPLPPEDSKQMTNAEIEESTRIFGIISDSKSAMLRVGHSKSKQRLLVDEKMLKSESPLKFIYMKNAFLREEGKKELEATVNVQCQ